MFKQFKQRLYHLPFVQFGSLTGSAAIGQIITYLMLPILARVYSPIEFSEFSKFISWVIPLSILASFKIELSTPKQRSVHDQYRTTFISLALMLAICLVISILLVIGKAIGIDFETIYWLLPIGIMSTTAPQILFFLNTSQQNNAQSASYRILNNIILQLTSVLLGYLSWGAYGLIIGYFIGQWVGIIILLKGHFFALCSWRNSIQWNTIFTEFREYILFATPQAIIETLQLSGTIFLLTLFFGEPYPGIFYICWRILQAPINLISNSIFVIEYNECSKLLSTQNSYSSRIKKSFSKLSIFGILLGAIFLLFGPDLFTLFLGEQHRLSGTMASFLALWFVIQFIVSPFSFTAILANKQRQSLLLNSLDIVSKCIAFFIGYQMDSIWIALGLYSVLSAIIGICIYKWYLQISP